jgi:transcriptional regulator with XRE-family HTH domain
MEINTLKERRKSLGLTIYDIAKSTNVSHSTVSRVENGIQGVSIESAQGMAKAYNLSLGDFIAMVDKLRKERGEYVAELEENSKKLSQLADEECKKRDERYESSVFLMGFDTGHDDEGGGDE